MDVCVYAAHIHMLDKIMMRLETQNKSHQVSMSDFNIVTTILATSYNVLSTYNIEHTKPFFCKILSIQFWVLVLSLWAISNESNE